MVKRKKSPRERPIQRKKSPKQTARQRKKMRRAKKKASKRRARGPGGFSSTQGDEFGRDHRSEWYDADINEMSQEELDLQQWHLNKDDHAYWGPPASPRTIERMRKKTRISRSPSISPPPSPRRKKGTRRALKIALLAALGATGYGAYRNRPNTVTQPPLPQGTYWQPPKRMPKPLELIGGKRKKKTKKKKKKN